MKKLSLQSKKPKTLSEYQEQVDVFKWAEIAQAEFPELEMLTGSLNGVRLSIGAAVKAKKAGLKRGYPDISLDVRRKDFAGLRIELKRSVEPFDFAFQGLDESDDFKEKGKCGVLSKEQRWWLWKLREQGFWAWCCYGADQAINEIKQYLKLPKQ